MVEVAIPLEYYIDLLEKIIEELPTESGNNSNDSSNDSKISRECPWSYSEVNEFWKVLAKRGWTFLASDEMQEVWGGLLNKLHALLIYLEAKGLIDETLVVETEKRIGEVECNDAMRVLRRHLPFYKKRLLELIKQYGSEEDVAAFATMLAAAAFAVYFIPRDIREELIGMLEQLKSTTQVS